MQRDAGRDRAPVRIAQLVDVLDREPRRARLDPEPGQEGIGVEPRVVLVPRRNAGGDLVGVGVELGQEDLVDEGDPHPLARPGPQHEWPGLVVGPVDAEVIVGQGQRWPVRQHVLQPPRVGEHVPPVLVLAPPGDHEVVAVRLRRPRGHGPGGAGRGRERRKVRVGRTGDESPDQPPAAQPQVVHRVERPEVVAGPVGAGFLRVDVEGERLGDAEGLLVDQRGRRVVPLPAPPHPVQHEAVLLLVRALDEPDPQALARVGADHAGVRIAEPARYAVRVRRLQLVRPVLAGAEPLRGVVAAEPQRRVAVVDGHRARVVVAAELARRVQRLAAPVVERDEVADRQAGLAVRRERVGVARARSRPRRPTTPCAF